MKRRHVVIPSFDPAVADDDDDDDGDGDEFTTKTGSTSDNSCYKGLLFARRRLLNLLISPLGGVFIIVGVVVISTSSAATTTTTTTTLGDGNMNRSWLPSLLMRSTSGGGNPASILAHHRPECNNFSKSILDQILVATPIIPPTTTTIKPMTTNSSSEKADPDLLHHHQINSRPLKVLCLLMTHSNADQQVRAVWDTWGQKCDKLLLASNTTITGGLPSIKMKTPSTYWNLWPKLNESLHYIVKQQQEHIHESNSSSSSSFSSSSSNPAEENFEEYDWIYKIDDDSFVIMENLKEFLSTFHNSPKLMERPLVFGYLLRDSKWSDFHQFFDLSKENRQFAKNFFPSIRDENQPTEYLAGGSGYVMNRRYLQKFISALDSTNNATTSSTTIYGAVPEDMAHGITMLANGIVPQNSRDTLGRERFLPESPDLWEFRNNNRQHHQQQQNTKNKRGRLSSSSLSKKKSTSNYAISFHHVQPAEMKAIYHRLYTCRTTA